MAKCASSLTQTRILAAIAWPQACVGQSVKPTIPALTDLAYNFLPQLQAAG